MKKAFILLSLCLLTSCGSREKPVSPSAILIANTTILDVRDGSLSEPRQVVIDSGTIRLISPTVPDPEAYSKVIDGRGKYLMPGLAEMHAHIPSPPVGRERVEETLFLYLSNGVTTIRGMLGHPSHLELRRQVEDGAVIGPRIITSSPSFNGNTVPSAHVADSLVRAYAADGYDFLKIHPGVQLQPFDTLVAAAREVGIPFSGHVPVAVGIRHALESRYASIDHVDGFLEGLVPASAGVSPDDNGFFGYNFTPLADSSAIADLVAMDKKNKVWVVPTQSLFERWFAPVTAETLLKDPEMVYMPASTLENWKKVKLETTGPETGFNPGQWNTFIELRRKLIKALQKDGQGLLLGSDAPQLFNVPGFSLHHEIQAMENAGLLPLEILQAGTINPALFFGMEDHFGYIAEGMSADLMLLHGNPLEDLNALKNPAGVMAKGHWLDRETIDAKLKEIAEHAATQ
jgi:imidazolonepropionase-like amidohydrolase